MKQGEKYFTWYESPSGYRQAFEATFTDSMVDRIRIREKRIAKSLRDAKDKVSL